MKTKHLHDMVIEAILKRGAIEVPSKTRKYRTFTRPAADGFYFVGKAGALRAGKSASNSVSLERGLSTWPSKRRTVTSLPSRK
jgi:hypothetical protein